MPLTMASVERIKLAATCCNSLATAIGTVGIFAPLVYLATTLDPVPGPRQSLFAGVMAICAIATMTLHLLGQAVLSLLEDHDLQEQENDSP